MSSLTPGRHDLSLSAWGPYTKRYIGVSHLADQEEGLRFDLSLVPALYRRGIQVPNVMFESGYHPWEAAPDLSYFCHRHQLEWKDQLYGDVSFSRIDEQGGVVRAELVNHSRVRQNLSLHLFASLHFPAATHDKSFAPLRPARPELPAGTCWHDATDYLEMQFARPRPTDFLTPEGLRRGEVRDHGLVRNRGLGDGFGREKGDFVSYRLSVCQRVPAACLLVRYRNREAKPSAFRIRGVVTERLLLEPSSDFSIARLELGDLEPGDALLHFEAEGGAAVELDGFVLAAGAEAEAVRFQIPARNPVPACVSQAGPASILLKYPEAPHWYGLAWNFEPFVKREILHSELDIFLRVKVHDHVSTRIEGDRKGHFTNALLGPIFLDPGASQVVHGRVCCGTESEVRDRLAEFAAGGVDCESICRRAREGAASGAVNPAGKEYLFSQQRMAATTLTNVVYPIYCRGRYIRHYTPGRWWDCLYSWDSGFIGLGLLEIDVQRAIDCLKAYLTEPGDPHGAFIHRGTPVPVQIYLAQEIWNRTHDRELLAFLYPRLRQYHRFLAGYGNSTTRKFKSNLLATWDYFYNSGGWDDYPPQKHVHQHRLTGSVAPVANTAHAIRTARILRLFAAEGLGLADDAREYEEEVRLFSDAILTHAWESESGYFGYVSHDEQGQPREILRHESGVNFNMGLDGAYPLVAGICTPDQEAALLERLRSGRHLWSRAGITTVDQSAPYFTPGGYWNGAVWMPHQWFFWKALLDLGHGELAHQIARNALDLWRDEVEGSYNCFEHFLVASRRGAGWHHFSGLSCPVLHWFGAYHRPGRLSAGYNTWIASHRFSDNNTRLEADLAFDGSSGASAKVLAVLHPDFHYTVAWNGNEVPSTSLYPGTVEATLPATCSAGRLTVTPKP